MTVRVLELVKPRIVDDVRAITASHIDDMIKNSSEKHKYPVTAGHMRAFGFPSDAIEASGVVRNIRKNEENTLLGDVEFTPEFDEKYEKGLYPSWSLYLSRTKVNGWELGHLAMLGSTMAAYKDLEEVKSTKLSQECSVDTNSPDSLLFSHNGDDPSIIEEWIFSVQPIEQKKQINKPVVNPGGGNEMTPEEILELKKKAAEGEAFAADNAAMKLRIEAQAKKDAEASELAFSVSLDEATESCKKLGISEDARTKLQTAFSALPRTQETAEAVSDMFSAFQSILSEVKPKVEPGRESDHNNVDENKTKMSFSTTEAVDAIS